MLDLPENPFEPLSIEELNRIRQRIIEGEEIEEEEFIKALQTLINQQGRDTAAVRKNGKGRTKKPKADLSDFLTEKKEAL